MTAALFLAVEDGFSFRTLVLFLIILAGVYFTQVAEREMLRFSFWFFPAISLLGFWLFTRESLLFASFPSLFGLALLIFAGVFFLLAGLGDFFFKERFLWYGIASTALLLATFLVFPPLIVLSLWWAFPFFFSLLLLFREAFFFFGAAGARRVRAISASLAFFGVELLFLLNFLPLGLLNAAAFLTLVFLLLRDAVAADFEGTLDRRFALREMTVFVLFALIIFASSRWTI